MSHNITLPPELLHNIGSRLDETTLTRARRTGRMGLAFPPPQQPLTAEYLNSAIRYPILHDVRIRSISS